MQSRKHTRIGLAWVAAASLWGGAETGFADPPAETATPAASRTTPRPATLDKGLLSPASRATTAAASNYLHQTVEGEQIGSGAAAGGAKPTPRRPFGKAYDARATQRAPKATSKTTAAQPAEGQVAKRREAKREPEEIRLVSSDSSSFEDQQAAVEAALNIKVTPIDLGTALQLAGVQNQELLLARQRVVATMAQRQYAAAQILPTINVGTNYDAHTGAVQQASGNILNVNRSAVYVGAGANAVAAGSVNIPGIGYNLNVSESVYNYLISKQTVEVDQFNSQAAENEVLLKVALAYTDLLRAEGDRSIAILVLMDARTVAEVTDAFAKTGLGRQADADRVRTEVERRGAIVLETDAVATAASARLAKLLNLEDNVRLHATENWVVPQPVVPDMIPLPELLAIALTNRPELKARQAAIKTAMLSLDAAKVLPFSPQLIAGFSAGGFGGGSDLVAGSSTPRFGAPVDQSRFGNFAARQDTDIIAYWSLRNIGIGNKALIDAARSRLRSSDLEQVVVLDKVREEVADAYVRTHSRYAQIRPRERGVRQGMAAYSEDLKRVRNNEGLAIEVLDSMRLLYRSRDEYLNAILDYNQAQFELYVALGKPPADVLAHPVPEGYVPPAAPPPAK